MHLPRLASILFALLAHSLVAQCANTWLREGGFPGTDASIRSLTTWDPDGNGPLSERVVMVGSFAHAGKVAANRVAAWDATTDTWFAFGTGADLNAASVLAMPSGDLVVGGFFSTMGGVPCSRIARWNGSTWNALGSGVAGSVLALARLPNGDVVAGGSFQTAGGVPAVNVARWDGTSWSAMGAGLTGGVSALGVMANGTLVAAGGFGAPGSVCTWNGTAWSPLGNTPISTVRCLCPLANGDLVIGGDFTSDALGNPIERVARWNGSSWLSMQGGMNSSVTSLRQLPNGDVLAGGSFGVAGGTSARGFARWNGTSWSSVGTALSGSTSLATVDSIAVLASGDVVGGGSFTQAGGVFASNLFRYDGNSYYTPTNGVDREILAATRIQNGDLVVAGSFATIDGTFANRIARFDGTQWLPLGSGLAPFPVLQPGACLLAEPNGDLVVGGDFTTAGGLQASGIARWNGTAWSAIGSGVNINGRVLALARLQNGDLVAGGTFTYAGLVATFGIARWNGVSWVAYGTGATQHPVLPIPGTVTSLLVARNGDLYAGGTFTLMNGVPATRIARFDGTTWSPLGSGADGQVLALAELPNGDIAAAGAISFVGGVPTPGVARWNGSTWSAFGTGLFGNVNALQVLPDGDLVATGAIQFSGATPVGNIARWDGSTWTSFGSGLDGTGRALALEANGNLFVGGEFVEVDGTVSTRMAHLTTTCPASSAVQDVGCAGSIEVQDGACLGGTFRARATGLPAIGFAFHTTSVTAIAPGLVPLSLVFPQAGNGCDLLVAPDFVGFTSLANGAAVSSMPMPSDPFLVGLVFYHQMVPVELDGLGATLAVTATASLRATIGAF